MYDLKAAIDGFLSGSLSAEELARLLPPDALPGQGLFERLADLAQRGDISREVFDTLTARLGGHTAPAAATTQSGPAPEPANDDATRIHVPRTEPLSTRGGQQALAATIAGPRPPGATDASAAGTRSGHTVSWFGESTPLEPGGVLRGRFVIESVLGSGGMGTVFKARDLRKEEALDRNPYVAVKVLSQEFRQHPKAFLALQREARKSQILAHPNIVTVHDFDRDGSTVYMTMEFLDGKPLDAVIREHRAKGGMSLEACWHIIEGVCRALAYAHEKGIVHADFKPGNVFITNDNTVKVLDFGIARAFDKPGLSSDKTYFDAGSLEALTFPYASCEMLEGDDPDPRDDIYALACVVCELLTGRHPYSRNKATDARDSGKKPTRIEALNRRQWRAFCEGLAFDRDARSVDVNHFFAGLQDERPARRPWLIPAIAAAVAVVAVGIGGTLALNSGTVSLDELPADNFVAPQITEDQAQMLLEQADYYLEMTAGSFDAELLAEGVSNANDALRTVLALQPENPQAIAGREEIARRFAAQARTLMDAGDDAASRKLVVIGLSKVDRRNRDLIRLYKQIGKPPESAAN